MFRARITNNDQLSEFYANKDREKLREEFKSSLKSINFYNDGFLANRMGNSIVNNLNASLLEMNSMNSLMIIDTQILEIGFRLEGIEEALKQMENDLFEAPHRNVEKTLKIMKQQCDTLKRVEAEFRLNADQLNNNPSRNPINRRDDIREQLMKNYEYAQKTFEKVFFDLSKIPFQSNLEIICERLQVLEQARNGLLVNLSLPNELSLSQISTSPSPRLHGDWVVDGNLLFTHMEESIATMHQVVQITKNSIKRFCVHVGENINRAKAKLEELRNRYIYIKNSVDSLPLSISGFAVEVNQQVALYQRRVIIKQNHEHLTKKAKEMKNITEKLSKFWGDASNNNSVPTDIVIRFKLKEKGKLENELCSLYLEYNHLALTNNQLCSIDNVCYFPDLMVRVDQKAHQLVDSRSVSLMIETMRI